jgi:predicted TIM-barrel fold metal-dependent hydrolase
MGLHVALKAQVKQNGYTDYHVHLQDSATIQLDYRMLKAIHEEPVKMDSVYLDADTAIQRLNKANFQYAWILSNAYLFGSPIIPVENEYEEVKKQNDWIAAQAARYPNRLKAFMSINPIKPYALQEIERCAQHKGFTGIKMHFRNSEINLLDTAQVKQLQKVFAAANKYHLLMLVHFRSSVKWDGIANTEILLKQLMPFAKDTKVVIAHMAGSGGYDISTDNTLKLIAAYLHDNNAHHKNLYVEMSAVFPLSLNDEYDSTKTNTNWNAVAALKKRINEIGIDHVLFGTDFPLIDMDDYVASLNKELGTSLVQQVLKSKVME